MLQNMFVVAFGTITGCDISYLRFNFINFFFFSNFLALKVIHLLLSTKSSLNSCSCRIRSLIIVFVFVRNMRLHLR